jgi:hypothetical protein
MDRIRRRDLEQLIAPRSGPCVSIFLPMHLTGREGMSDPVRLRELADQAEQRLIDRGLRRPQARELLAPLRDLPADPVAWQQRGHGVAYYAADGFQRMLHTTTQLPAAVEVEDYFCVRPLIPLLSEDERFYVLTLSQKKVKLYQGDARELVELEVEGLPRDLEDALKIEDADRGEQVHSAARLAGPGGERKNNAVFHGQGGEPDHLKADLKSYLDLVARAVDRHLNSEKAPLVLATVEGNVPLWKSASRYRYLVDEVVAGNPDYLSLHELHAKAWAVAQPALARKREMAMKRLRQAEGSRVAVGLTQVVVAAMAGQIDTLFVDCRESRWGKYDPEQHAAELHWERQSGDVDLVELAVAQTLSHKGDVFAYQGNGAPGHAEALLRF